MRNWFEREGLNVLRTDYVRVFFSQNGKEGSDAISRNMGRRACARKHDRTAIDGTKVGMVFKL